MHDPTDSAPTGPIPTDPSGSPGPSGSPPEDPGLESTRDAGPAASNATGPRGVVGPPRGASMCWGYLALLPFAALVWRFYWVCDDAYISFRYSRNFAAGEGLVFNSGERVEGYSNLLWVLLGALFEALGVHPADGVRVVSALCGAILVIWVGRFASRSLALGPMGVAGAALIFGCFPPSGLWATSGLATMPFALVLFGAFASLFGNPERSRGVAAGVFGLLAILLRADGFLFLGAMFGMVVLWALWNRNAGLRRSGLWALGILGVGFAALTCWRLAYYGDWVPNTARVKGSITGATIQRGSRYVLQYVLTFASLPLLALCAAVGAGWWRGTLLLAALAATLFGLNELALGVKNAPSNSELNTALAGAAVGGVLLVASLLKLRSRSGPLIGGMALLPFAYAVGVGGDFMAMGRFLVPALPFVALGAAIGLDRVARRGALGSGVSGVVLAGALTLGLLPGFDIHVVPADRPIPEGRLVAEGRSLPEGQAEEDRPREDLRAKYHFRWNSLEFKSEYQAWYGMKSRAWIWQTVGKTVGAYTEEGKSLVAGAIGALGYYSGRYIFDQNGLVTKSVLDAPLPKVERSPGHDRFVTREFFRDQNPDHVMVNLYDLKKGKFLISERWYHGRSPEMTPRLFHVTMVLRSDAPMAQRNQVFQRGYQVEILDPEEDHVLRDGYALRLISWR